MNTTGLDQLDVADQSASTDALRAQLASNGYLFFRSLIDPSAVSATRAAVLGALDECGWLADGSRRNDALPSDKVRREEANADPAFFDAYKAIQHLQAFHELAHTPSLIALMTRLVGEPLLVHPRKIARIGLPKDPYIVGAHQDFPLNHGSPDVLTAWVPLGDCPDEMGGLKVLAGSHRAGLRPVAAVPNVGGLKVAEPLDDAPGWRTADFRAGDVLVFHSLTVHAAKANHTDRLRLSSDFRYQNASDPVAEGSLVPHYFPVVPGHDELTASWTATDAIATPDTLLVVDGFDPFVGPPQPVSSRLVTLD
ncbi:MAG: hypothetical protein QOF21_925 [Actinomycetota bacterium]